MARPKADLKTVSKRYKKESLRSLEFKFKGYYTKVTGRDSVSNEMSTFEFEMFKAIERVLGERGYKFEKEYQPLFYKRAS